MTTLEQIEEINPLIEEQWPGWKLNKARTGKVWRLLSRYPAVQIKRALERHFDASDLNYPKLSAVAEYLSATGECEGADAYDALSDDMRRVDCARRVHPKATDGLNDQDVLAKLRWMDGYRGRRLAEVAAFRK